MNKTAAELKREMEKAQAKAVELQKELAKAMKSEAKDFANTVAGYIEEFGHSVDEIASLLVGKKSKAVKAAPKYVNLENSSQTYGGKGPKPKWLKERIEKMGLVPTNPEDTRKALVDCLAG